MREQWRSIDGFPHYKVSDHGQVMSLRRNRPMKFTQSWDRHLFVHLFEGGERRRWGVHQLVLHAFHGPCPDGLEVSHLDGDGCNNHLANLCYMTHAENMRLRGVHGKTAKGSRHGRAKLSDAQVLTARVSPESTTVLSERYGISWRNLWCARTGRSWTHLPMDPDEVRAMLKEAYNVEL